MNVHVENEILRRRLGEIASGTVFQPAQHAAAGLSEANLAASETLKVITVRLPESLHASLKQRARKHGLSMNELCVRMLAPERNRDATPTTVAGL